MSHHAVIETGTRYPAYASLDQLISEVGEEINTPNTTSRRREKLHPVNPSSVKKAAEQFAQDFSNKLKGSRMRRILRQ